MNARADLRYLWPQYMGKTCLYKIHFNSSEWIDTPQFLSYLNRLWVGDMISCLIWPSINSWRHHNGLRTQNFNLHIMTSADFRNWLYLCKYQSIFFQILICSTWEYSLQMQLPRYFILTMVSWRIFAIKEGMSIFHILRVFSMGHDFFSKLDSTFSSFASNISVVLSSFTLSFEYVVAETISYHKCALYFSFRCRDHAHISLPKWDLRIPFSVYV